MPIRTITKFIRQCPCCQVMSPLKILIKMHPFTCDSYNPFESLHIDHIRPIPSDDKDNTHILVMINAYSRARPRLPGASSTIYVDSEHPTSCTLTRSTIFSQSYRGCPRSSIASPQRTRKRRSHSALTKKPCFLTHACTISGPTNSYPW